MSKVDQSYYESIVAWDIQNSIHLSTPSIDLTGVIHGKIRHLYEHTLRPELVITLLDTARTRNDMITKLVGMRSFSLK